MLDGQKLTGIGEINFIAGRRLTMNNQLIGLTLMYSAIHGVEDKIDPLS